MLSIEHIRLVRAVATYRRGVCLAWLGRDPEWNGLLARLSDRAPADFARLVRAVYTGYEAAADKEAYVAATRAKLGFVGPGPSLTEATERTAAHMRLYQTADQVAVRAG